MVKQFLSHVIDLKNEHGEKFDKWVTGITTYKRRTINTVVKFQCPCLHNAYYVNFRAMLGIMLSNESILSHILIEKEQGISKNGCLRGLKDRNAKRGFTLFNGEDDADGVTNIDLRFILHIDDVNMSVGTKRGYVTNMTIASFVLDNLPCNRTEKRREMTPLMIVRTEYTKDDCLHHFISKIATDIRWYQVS